VRVFVREPALGVTVLVIVALMVAFIMVPLGYVVITAGFGG